MPYLQEAGHPILEWFGFRAIRAHDQTVEAGFGDQEYVSYPTLTRHPMPSLLIVIQTSTSLGGGIDSIRLVPSKLEDFADVSGNKPRVAIKSYDTKLIGAEKFCRKNLKGGLDMRRCFIPPWPGLVVQLALDRHDEVSCA